MQKNTIKKKNKLDEAAYLPEAALARYLGVSPSWVNRNYKTWVTDGVRFAIWCGRKFFFRKDIDRIMNRNCQVNTN